MGKDPNPRGVPPAEVERLIQRHVRRHLSNAAADLAAALAPLRERTVYHGSPLTKAIADAHRAAVIAERAAESWALRTAPQGEAFMEFPGPTPEENGVEEPPEGCFPGGGWGLR